MRKIFRKIGIVGIALLMLGVIGSIFNTTKASADSMSFDVQPIGYKKIGYFKFNAKPNQKVDLPLQVRNLTTHTITVDIYKLNALTSVYGNTQYDVRDKLPNSRITDKRYIMAQYLTGPSSVTLTSGQTKVIHYELVTPNNVNEGTLLGGIGLREHGSGSNKKVNGKITFYNQVERVIGVEGDYSRKSVNVLVNSPSVKTTASSPYINIPLSNSSPMIATNLNVNYEVSKGNKPLFKGNTGEFKMAPFTEISYPANWNYKTYQPGIYTIKVALNSSNKTINQSYTIEVKKKDVSDYKKYTGKITKPTPSMGTNSSGLTLLLSIGIGILSGAGVVILFIFLKRKEKKKDSIDQKQKAS